MSWEKYDAARKAAHLATQKAQRATIEAVTHATKENHNAARTAHHEASSAHVYAQRLGQRDFHANESNKHMAAFRSHDAQMQAMTKVSDRGIKTRFKKNYDSVVKKASEASDHAQGATARAMKSGSGHAHALAANAHNVAVHAHHFARDVVISVSDREYHQERLNQHQRERDYHDTESQHAPLRRK